MRLDWPPIPGKYQNYAGNFIYVKLQNIEGWVQNSNNSTANTGANAVLYNFSIYHNVVIHVFFFLTDSGGQLNIKTPSY